MKLNSMNTCVDNSMKCVSLHCTAGAAIGTGEHKTEFTVDL